MHIRWRGARFAATQHQQVRDCVGSGGSSVCTVRQLHRTDEVAKVVHCAAYCGL